MGAGCADVSARAVESGDDETKAAAPSAMIETRGTLRVIGTASSDRAARRPARSFSQCRKRPIRSSGSLIRPGLAGRDRAPSDRARPCPAGRPRVGDHRAGAQTPARAERSIIARTADARDVEISESGAGSPATPSTCSTEKPIFAETSSTSNKRSGRVSKPLPLGLELSLERNAKKALGTELRPKLTGWQFQATFRTDPFAISP
jgi:hypothetical protein